MIPLRDHNPSGTFPWVTYALIAINVGVFVYMFGMSETALDIFVRTYAVQPAEIAAGTNLLTLITAMFMHGSIGHIFGNMLFLNIFGDNLEDRLGHLKYLGYYLACGIAASALQIVVAPLSLIPNLGASGAIAGLMGGYLVLFPRHQIDVLLPVFGWLSQATVPAYTMLFYWFIVQLFSGAGSIGIDGGGIAYFAHVGGFAAGVILVKILGMRRERNWE